MRHMRHGKARAPQQQRHWIDSQSTRKKETGKGRAATFSIAAQTTKGEELSFFNLVLNTRHLGEWRQHSERQIVTRKIELEQYIYDRQGRRYAWSIFIFYSLPKRHMHDGTARATTTATATQERQSKNTGERREGGEQPFQ